MNDDDEVLNLVDENDTLLGPILRKDEFTKPENTYVRVVNCFLVNDDKEILVPTRSPNKKMFPNALDFSCGGQVGFGESYEDAMRREIKEELGIDAGKGLTMIEIANPQILNSDTFCGLFRLNWNGDINWNREDFTQVRWLKKEAILEEIENGVLYERDLDILLKRFTL